MTGLLTCSALSSGVDKLSLPSQNKGIGSLGTFAALNIVLNSSRAQTFAGGKKIYKPALVKIIFEKWCSEHVEINIPLNRQWNELSGYVFPKETLGEANRHNVKLA